MDTEENLARFKKAHLHKFANTVTITLYCNSEYAAQVLMEDLSERLKDGEEIIIQMER